MKNIRRIMAKTIIRHFSMPEKLSRLLNQLAEKMGMNKSELIRAAIRHYAKEVENGNYRKKA